MARLLEQFDPNINELGLTTNKNGTLGGNYTFSGTVTLSGTVVGALTNPVTSSAASAFAVGPNGATNPIFQIDASETSAATGLLVEGFAAGSGVNLEVQSSGTNENLDIEAKGSGTITLNGIATGGITLSTRVSAPNGLAPTIPVAGNVTGLTVSQNDTTNNPSAVVINNTGTGIGLDLESTAKFSAGTASITAGGQGNASWYFLTSTTNHGLYIDYAGTPASNRHGVVITTRNTSGAGASLWITDSNTNSNWGTFYLSSVRTGVGAQVIVHSFATNTANPAFQSQGTQTITGTTADGMVTSIQLTPTYTAATAQTVTRHNYLDINQPTLSGAGPAALTDAAVMRFNAAAGTHKAVDAATTKTTPTGVDAWIKINLNGTIAYVPAYLSKTA